MGSLQNLWEAGELDSEVAQAGKNAPDYSGNCNGKDVTAIAAGHRLYCLPRGHDQHRIKLQGPQPFLPLAARSSDNAAAPTGHQNEFCMVPASSRD